MSVASPWLRLRKAIDDLTTGGSGVIADATRFLTAHGVSKAHTKNTALQLYAYLQTKLGTLAQQNANNVTITGGAISGTTIDGVSIKAYVDAVALGTGAKAICRVATTANITIATALNNGDVLDGVTLVTGDLVLVKDQSSAAQNGVVVVGATPARAAEFDTYNEYAGALITVQEGTANGDTIWLCTSNRGGTLDSTALAFQKMTPGFLGALAAASNLSDLANAATARTNIGLGNVDNTSDATKNAAAVTLTNKTIALGSNTVSGTTAQFNTALTDGDFATLAGAETLTNKTLTAPAISSPTGIVKGDVGLGNVDNTSDATKNAAAVTLTNKTIALGANTVSGTTAQFNTALTDGDFATLAGAETLTGKTINLTSNTLTGTTAQFNTALSDGDFATLAGTETLTGKTFNTAGSGNVLQINSNTINAKTGSGSTIALSTSPQLTGTVNMDNFSTTPDLSGLLTFGRFSSGYPWVLMRADTTATGMEFRNFDGSSLLLTLNASTGAVSVPSVGTTASAANAFLDNAASNKLLRSTSSLRYKHGIEDLAASVARGSLDLWPIWYRSKAEADNPAHSFYGHAAEAVAQFDPRLVTWTWREEDIEQIVEHKVIRAAVAEERDADGAVAVEAQPEERAQFVTRVVKPGAVKVPDGVMYDRVAALQIAGLVLENRDLKQALADLAARVAAVENASSKKAPR